MIFKTWVDRCCLTLFPSVRRPPSLCGRPRSPDSSAWPWQVQLEQTWLRPRWGAPGKPGDGKEKTVGNKASVDLWSHSIRKKWWWRLFQLVIVIDDNNNNRIMMMLILLSLDISLKIAIVALTPTWTSRAMYEPATVAKPPVMTACSSDFVNLYRKGFMIMQDSAWYEEL